MRRTLISVTLVLALTAGGARAQRLDVWLDASGAHAAPPAGLVDYDPSTYGLLGARARMLAPHGLTLDGGASGGRIMSEDGRGWLGGNGAAELFRAFGRLSLSGRLEGFATELRGGTTQETEFRHRTFGTTVRPRAAMRFGRVVLAGTFEATAARLSTEYSTLADPLRELPVVGRGPGVPGLAQHEVTRERADLSLIGAGVELRAPLGPFTVFGGADDVRTRHGGGEDRYQILTAGAATYFGATDLAVSARWQHRDGPDDGGELGAHVGLGHALGQRFYGRIAVGRTVSDPLFGTPGHMTVSAGLTVRVGGVGAGAYRKTPVIEVGAPVQGGRRVRFQVRVPNAQAVAVAGDFSNWQPWPLRPAGDHWVLEAVLAPGLHRFSFVIDGDRWMVPEDAPGVVDDGWGQRNATVLIETG